MEKLEPQLEKIRHYISYRQTLQILVRRKILSQLFSKELELKRNKIDTFHVFLKQVGFNNQNWIY